MERVIRVIKIDIFSLIRIIVTRTDMEYIHFGKRFLFVILTRNIAGWLDFSSLIIGNVAIIGNWCSFHFLWRNYNFDFRSYFM